MTDGVPNGGTSEQAQCTKAARDRLNDGILTFSVGIGNLTPYSPNSYDAKFMAQIALAGGTAKENCNPSELTDESKMCHFQVTPGDKTPELLSKDFVAAMNKIRTAISSCDYLLDRKKFPNLVPEKVKVAYVGSNGTKVDIPKDAVNGWTFDDPTLPYTVSLHGSFCEQARQDTTGKVTIVPGCDL